MPNYKANFGSFLKAEDLQGKQLRLVIEKVEVEEVKNDDGKENKLVVRFAGKEKGLILNRTNADKLAELTGSDDYDNWLGLQIVLWVDPSVKFGTKLTPGLRIKGVSMGAAERGIARPAPATPAPVADVVDGDDIPF